MHVNNACQLVMLTLHGRYLLSGRWVDHLDGLFHSGARGNDSTAKGADAELKPDAGQRSGCHTRRDQANDTLEPAGQTE